MLQQAPLHATFLLGGSPATIIVSLDAVGVPSVTDRDGVPFLAVPFPIDGLAGGEACAPLIVAPGDSIAVGAGTATAAGLAGAVTFFSVA